VVALKYNLLILLKYLRINPQLNLKFHQLLLCNLGRKRAYTSTIKSKLLKLSAENLARHSTGKPFIDTHDYRVRSNFQTSTKQPQLVPYYFWYSFEKIIAIC
jgi:hypothetical protein